ncbi:hypothetical protein Ciccas_011056, partial [Cichlidogyrus casuarinus]
LEKGKKKRPEVAPLTRPKRSLFGSSSHTSSSSTTTPMSSRDPSFNIGPPPKAKAGSSVQHGAAARKRPTSSNIQKPSKDGSLLVIAPESRDQGPLVHFVTPGKSS